MSRSENKCAHWYVIVKSCCVFGQLY